MTAITRQKALEISSEYVAFVEGDFDKFEAVDAAFSKLKRGQKVITYFEKQFVEATVSSVNHQSFRAIDGPVVRVKNERGSWRVDGNRYAFPVKVGK